MGHGKLRKFAEMETMPNVVQAPVNALAALCRQGGKTQELPAESLPENPLSAIKGHWNLFFENLKGLPAQTVGDAPPLILELGCGRGEYTVGLARRFPDSNFIGIDIKGARMWHGARQAMAEKLTNAAFLRTRIEFIDTFFSPGEVSEIWLTFSDPQMKKPTKRLTSTTFLERYRRIMSDGGTIHLKTDSPFLFTYTTHLLRVNGITPEALIQDVHSPSLKEDPETALLREVRTCYEEMWLQRGIAIKYLRFRLPRSGTLVEPQVDIPLDDYRSYNRSKRSGKDTGR